MKSVNLMTLGARVSRVPQWESIISESKLS
jgi:hypothetical protein